MKLIHTLKPIYDKNSKILILGSFPSEISRINNFYYANKNNRFWKVIEIIFNVKLNNNDEKIKFLHTHNIALWDVIYSCEINKSNDASIKNVIPNDIKKIIYSSNIKCIFLTGKTALKYFNKYIANDIKINAICLPSTSSANAVFSLNKLVKEYQVILEYLGV
jgi:hypoxanthine-DNA glycosylase